MQKPFERVIINQRERPLSTDIDDLESRLDRTTRDILRHAFAKRGSYTDGSMDGFTALNGFLGDAFKADPTNPTGMTVNLRPGFGFIDNPNDCPTALGSTPIVGLDDLSPYKPLVLTLAQLVTVDAAPSSGSYRIDLIEAIYDRQLTDAAVRGILDPNLGSFVGTTVNKSLSFTLDGLVGRVVSPANSTSPIGYKVGPVINGSITPFGATSPAPSLSPGYMPVAEIIVFGGGTGAGGSDVTTVLDRHNIRDKRTLVHYDRTGKVRVRLSYDPTSGTSKPTILSVSGPPGVLVTAVGADSASTLKGLVNLYIVPGGLVNAVDAQARVISAAVPSDVTNEKIDTFATGLALSTFAALTADDTAANGSRSSSPFRLAVGQPVIEVSLEAASLILTGGAAPSSSAHLTNPLVYDVSVSYAY